MHELCYSNLRILHWLAMKKQEAIPHPDD